MSTDLNGKILKTNTVITNCNTIQNVIIGSSKSCTPAEFVPLWKVYGFTRMDSVALVTSNASNSTNNKNVCLNIKVNKNIKIPENVQMKFKWKIDDEIVNKIRQKKCEERLLHRTRSCST
ncbi:uncharacterized protein LOC116336592 [Contarinia nasturtii]|uniref:uncharacterized protein LOC116336592 n=1 Tax=Contarinia nasturtii TaxID=265458 RepID=UPI0012D4548F|nr:uncharacterized protein LOC116336592 [Contarinia nasturtii]